MHEGNRRNLLTHKAISLILFLAMIGWMGGCAGNNPYSYEAIQEEYAGKVRPPEQPPAVAEAPEPETAVPAEPLSLAESIRISLNNNPDLRMAVARIRQAEAMIRQANAAFYPAIGLYTEYTRADAPSVYLFKKIDQRQLPPDANFNRPGILDNYESGVNARWNIFNGGRDILNRQMAVTDLTISRLDRQSVRNGLVASVIQSYFDTLAARDFIKIAEGSVNTVQKQLELMRVRLRGGSVLKSDVLSLEVRLAEAREELLRGRNQYRIALTALAHVLGISPDVALVLKENAEVPPLPVPEEYAEGVEYGMKYRPNRNMAKERVRKARMAIDAARAGYLPRIDLQGKYYLDDDELDYDTDRENWMIAVMLNWDLFTGFRTMAAVEKASAMLAETLAADRQAELALKMDVKTAYLNLEEARARLDVARKSLVSAEESLNLVRKQYDGGSATITRYLEAELDWNRAQIRATAAYFDQEKAVADLGRAIGYWARAVEIEDE